MTIPDNAPALWHRALPRLKPDGSKYDRGYAVVLGGPINSTGAARLAARAALRIGAGLVSVACDATSLPVYAGALEAVMTKPVRDAANYGELLHDKRITALLLGPGAGLGERTGEFVLTALKSHRPCVLDADALTVFRHSQSMLFAAIAGPVLLTPHEGEFARLFWEVSTRIEDAHRAARQANAVVLLKGADTVIAAPDGRVVVNRAAPPQLATAGTGDVLAGLATGLMAQGMEAFEAACASVWFHAEAARRFGAGLIAEDLEREIPGILRDLVAAGY
jgi:hydroxyethylthiazole kinase-like uncharacterized protein yjeF